jgi:Gdp/GTP exchange factor required for growth at low temperatures
VQKLRKVAVDCRDIHTRGHGSRKRSAEGSNPIPPAPVDFSQGDFAENLRKAVGKDDNADIDLDLDDSQAMDMEIGLNSNTSPGGKPTLDLAMMGQPLHLAYLQIGKQGSGITEAVQSQLPLPMPHSALSRVVVNAIGRLGRWKRVLNYRAMNTRATPTRPSIGLGAACIDASSFDVESNETGDLLLEKGGVEKYLKMLESRSGRKAMPGTSLVHAFSVPPPLGLVPGISSASIATTAVSTAPSASPGPPIQNPSEVNDNQGAEIVPEPTRPLSSQSSLTSESVQFRHSVSEASTSDRPRWDMDIVSIDDLDISDLSTDDLHAPLPPAGLRKMGRRLPNRRDFEFVRRSVDSVSSMGIHTNPGHDSILSGGSSVTSSISVGPEMAGPIHDWQMTALVNSLSDEDEPGDVDAALKRLEGQINSDKQKQKQSKVDAWIKSINRQRYGNATGQFNAGLQRYSSDEEDYGEVQRSLRDGPTSGSHVSSRSSISSARSPTSIAAPIEQLSPAVPPGLATSDASDDVNSVHQVEPSAELVSHSSPHNATSPPPEPNYPLSSTPMTIAADSSSFVKPEKSVKKHRSFVLSYKSETIVQHFSMIDRDLFLSLRFEELVSPEWMSSAQDSNILDWAQYVKERHEMKLERRGNVPSALVVIRNRFNLTVNFVISEIVLTHPTERVMIYSKFIRIAWVSV